ncbi:hypothetical protein C2G38_2107136, partial [Gigaspora rosea]
NPKPQPKPRNCQNINNLFVYSKVGAEILLCQIHYNFRNLIRNSKPHPTPETSFKTRKLHLNTKNYQT